MNHSVVPQLHADKGRVQVSDVPIRVSHRYPSADRATWPAANFSQNPSFTAFDGNEEEQAEENFGISLSKPVSASTLLSVRRRRSMPLDVTGATLINKTTDQLDTDANGGELTEKGESKVRSSRFCSFILSIAVNLNYLYS